MSTKGKTIVSYSTRGIPKYEIEIRHDELKKYQVVRGDDQYVVDQKAMYKMAQWDEMRKGGATLLVREGLGDWTIK